MVALAATWTMSLVPASLVIEMDTSVATIAEVTWALALSIVWTKLSGFDAAADTAVSSLCNTRATAEFDPSWL